jgi:AcrR family transcriptional regulator
MAGMIRRKSGSTAPVRRRSWESSPQAQKSAQTQNQLIEATIRCILKFGYANTTTTRVATEAGLSRGAMLHHFENGPALIHAAVEYLHEKRLKAFRRAVNSVPSPDDVKGLLLGYWRQINHPTFLVFHELAIAARTDPSLSKILIPAQAEFNRQWYLQAIELFPDWQDDRERFDLALALTRNTMEGMAINNLVYGLDAGLIDRLLTHLEQQIRSLHPPLPKA